MTEKSSVGTEVLNTMNRVYAHALTTTSGGNVSAVDDEENVWITPSGIDKGTLTPPDIAKVLPDGSWEGRYAPSMEIPFHAGIYRLRKDIRGIVHAHAPAVVAYACARKIPEPKVARIYADVLGEISGSVYDLPGSLKLGEIVKAEFKKGFSAVMMDNHGATVGGRDLADAYRKYETLDDLCNTLINAAILGSVKMQKNEIGLPKWDITESKIEVSEEIRAAKESVVAFLKRSYKNRLAGASWGTFALRVGAGYVLNRDESDRERLTAEDILYVENGKKSGCGNAQYAPYVERILKSCLQANAVFISHPCAIMGFAVANVPFDSKLIPESYLMLKEVGQLPYEAVSDANRVAEKLTIKTPVAVMDNECAITIGKNAIKAFDRMEVLDYSARSVIGAKHLAELVPINAEQTAEIDRTFDGW